MKQKKRKKSTLHNKSTWVSGSSQRRQSTSAKIHITEKMMLDALKKHLIVRWKKTWTKHEKRSGRKKWELTITDNISDTPIYLYGKTLQFFGKTSHSIRQQVTYFLETRIRLSHKEAEIYCTDTPTLPKRGFLRELGVTMARRNEEKRKPPEIDLSWKIAMKRKLGAMAILAEEKEDALTAIAAEEIASKKILEKSEKNVARIIATNALNRRQEKGEKIFTPKPTYLKIIYQKRDGTKIYESPDKIHNI